MKVHLAAILCLIAASVFAQPLSSADVVGNARAGALFAEGAGSKGATCPPKADEHSQKVHYLVPDPPSRMVITDESGKNVGYAVGDKYYPVSKVGADKSHNENKEATAGKAANASPSSRDSKPKVSASSPQAEKPTAGSPVSASPALFCHNSDAQSVTIRQERYETMEQAAEALNNELGANDSESYAYIVKDTTGNPPAYYVTEPTSDGDSGSVTPQRTDGDCSKVFHGQFETVGDYHNHPGGRDYIPPSEADFIGLRSEKPPFTSFMGNKDGLVAADWNGDNVSMSWVKDGKRDHAIDPKKEKGVWIDPDSVRDLKISNQECKVFDRYDGGKKKSPHAICGTDDNMKEYRLKEERSESSDDDWEKLGDAVPVDTSIGFDMTMMSPADIAVEYFKAQGVRDFGRIKALAVDELAPILDELIASEREKERDDFYSQVARSRVAKYSRVDCTVEKTVTAKDGGDEEFAEGLQMLDLANELLKGAGHPVLPAAASAPEGIVMVKVSCPQHGSGYTNRANIFLKRIKNRWWVLASLFQGEPDFSWLN